MCRVDKTIKSLICIAYYALAFSLTGCGRHYGEVGIHQKERSLVVAKSDQATKASGVSAKTTKKTTTTPMARSLVTLLACLSQIRPGCGNDNYNNSLIQLMYRHIPLLEPIYQYMPDRVSATKHGDSYTMNIGGCGHVINCAKQCNKELKSILLRTSELRQNNRPSKRINLYVTSTPELSLRDLYSSSEEEEEDNSAFSPDHELFSRMNQMYYKWKEECPSNGDNSCNDTDSSPPYEVQKILRRASGNITQEIEGLRETALLILSQENQLRGWCNANARDERGRYNRSIDEKNAFLIDDQLKAFGFIRSANTLLDLADSRTIIVNTKALLKKLAHCECNTERNIQNGPMPVLSHNTHQTAQSRASRSIKMEEAAQRRAKQKKVVPIQQSRSQRHHSKSHHKHSFFRR